MTDKETIAEETARIYLDTGAVRFMQDKPFIFTRGRQEQQQIRPEDAGRGREVHARSGRLVEGAWRRR
jgi:hypothetical protein